MKAFKSIGLFLLLLQTTFIHAQVSFQTKSFKFSLSKEGRVTELTDVSANKNYLYSDSATSLLNIKTDDKFFQPNAIQWQNKTSLLTLSYPENIQATIKVVQNNSYLSFELVKISNKEKVQTIIWGPYPTTISETIGEIVGVVRNKDFAIGIQALNIKTLGGSVQENDVLPSYDVFEGGNLVDIKKEDVNKKLYRGDVAKPTSYGSLLQAYCKNRDKDRIIKNWQYQNYYSPAFNDGGIAGTKLAIFGVSAKDALSVIGEIEVKENLPHPLLDGVWGKQNIRASESYLIMNFGPKNIDEAIAYTKKAGLRYLYHGDAFETWGHFKLRSKDFPDNWKSLKECVEVAKKQNVRLGVHTLSNFITTNDPYVTPVPDKRLARVGYSQLAENIDATTKDIAIKDSMFFSQLKANTLKAAVIDNEIIRYTALSSTAPWKLLDCQRGAFNTVASKHNANDSIGHLADHAYKVFLGNHDLDQEIAKNIASLFNETGLMQLSFDGLEGCYSESMGDYSKQMFTQTWYDHLSPELKGKVINDASMPGHFFWHVYTRMNWGEPWYAGFRESHLQLRLKNQQLFQRNLMPSMLGWFSLKAETTLEDIEWMLTRAAGFNAGFALVTSTETLKKHGRGEEILSAINLWETARMQNVFTDEQKQKMQDVKNEFHLEQKNGAYVLTPIINAHFVHAQKIKQPGEPTYSTYQFNNTANTQTVAFIINMADSKDAENISFDNPSIAINQQDALLLPINLKKNDILYCDGKTVKLYNKQWQLQKTFELTKPLPSLVNGKNEITFDGIYSGENGADIKIEIRAKGAEEIVKK